MRGFPFEIGVRGRGIAQVAKSAAFLLQDYLSGLSPSVKSSVIYHKIFQHLGGSCGWKNGTLQWQD